MTTKQVRIDLQGESILWESRNVLIVDRGNA
jgi:hypothetical protein